MKKIKHLFVFCIIFSLISETQCFANSSYILQNSNNYDFEFKQITKKETENCDILEEDENNPIIPVFTMESKKTIENIDILSEKDFHNIETNFRKVSPEEYDQKTVSKHYNIYEAYVKNNNYRDLLLSSDSEVFFNLRDNTNIKSENRRKIYKKVRKKDIGRFCVFSMPGAIIAGGITGFTFFLGAPIAAAVYVGMQLPTAKAVRANVKISQDLYNRYKIPIKFEEGVEYKILFFVPKDKDLQEIVISNVFFEQGKTQNLMIKAQQL